MANYIGLQGIFNALAGGGANAVNIYAQEKDRQRRLAFDEKKFEADQAYKKQVLDQDQQRIDHATRAQDFVENKWQHLEDQKRREGVVDLQYRLAGNLRAMALERGYESPRDMAKAGDADAMNYFNSGIQNLARYTTNKDLTTELVEAGTDEAGDKLFTIRYSDGSKNRIFGGAATLDDIAGRVNAFNLEVGIPVFAARNGMAIDYDQNGRAMLVNKEGKPELSPDQQKAAAELDQQIKDQTGRSLQETLDNPVMPEVKAELEKGLAYEGMPSGERAEPTKKPRNLNEFYAREFEGNKEAVASIPYVQAYEEAGGGAKGSLAATGSALGSAAKGLTYLGKEGWDALGWYGDQIIDGVGTLAGSAVDSFNGNPPTQKAETPEVTEQSATQPSAAPTNTPAAGTVTSQASKAQEQVVKQQTSPKRAAAIFANQMMAAGGKDAMGSVQAQAIYQELLKGNPEAKAAASASMTVGNSKKDVDAYAKFHKTILDQINPHIENHARLALDGQEGQEGFEQKVKLYESGIRDSLYAFSTEMKNMGYDIGKLSRHPESYRDMVSMVAKYYDAKRKAIKNNENLGWFGSKQELPNMTNFMLKTISKTAPKTAERMALSMAFEQNPDGDSGTIAEEAQALMQQWSALETFMDEPAE